MSALEDIDIKEIQTKISHHIDELEEKVKNSKIYWNHCELTFDKDFVQNFIDGHYNEIVHHLSQIKHHLEQINHHKKELEDIQLHLTTAPKAHNCQDIPNEQDLNHEQKDKIVKRPEEDKCRFLSRRSSRSSSLKYVLQWEKILDEQNGENILSSVKRRLRNEAKSVNQETDISNIMVKNRVLQFEGFRKPKRVSSTVETFLDFSGEKPKRIQSYPILEEIEDEDEFERPKSCDFERVCEDDPSNSDSQELFVNSENPEDKSGGFGDGLSMKELSNIKEENNNRQNVQGDGLVNSEPVEEVSALARDDHLNGVKDISENTNLITEETNETLMENRRLSLKESTEDSLHEEEESKCEEEIFRKPRIVEIHYKKHPIADLNLQEVSPT